MSRWPFAVALAMAGVAGSALLAPPAAASDGAAAVLEAVVATSSSEATWSLRLPQDGRVAFRGVVSFDEAGTGTGTFMYPAPNAAGLLAAVLTHGFLVDSAKKEQKDRLQAAADGVLLPYKAVLDGFATRDLMQRSLAKTATGANGKIIEAGGNPGSATLVESLPVFSLTQDQNTIVLDNAIAILAPGAQPAAAYRNTVRVVSTAAEGTDPAALWTADEGAKLKEQSAQLVAESLDIAFGDAAAGRAREEIPYRTIRYREGSAEKIERAQVVSDRCGRLVIRTLRGTLMSVPASRAATAVGADDRCGRATVSSN